MLEHTARATVQHLPEDFLPLPERRNSTLISQQLLFVLQQRDTEQLMDCPSLSTTLLQTFPANQQLVIDTSPLHTSSSVGETLPARSHSETPISVELRVWNLP